MEPGDALPNQPNIEKVLSDIYGAHRTWNRMAFLFRTTLTLLGIIAVSSSLLITAFVETKYLDNYINIRWVAYTASLSLALLTSFNIVSRGNNARNAWRHLQVAKLLYMAGEASIKDLIKAYEEAEAILGNTDFSYQVPGKNQ